LISSFKTLQETKQVFAFGLDIHQFFSDVFLRTITNVSFLIRKLSRNSSVW
jgi:hypothetical protein